MEKITIESLKKDFVHNYGGDLKDVRLFFAPGRVNLIGEHTDYNNGYVMPFGLQYGTWLMVRPASDAVLKLRSLNFGGNAQVCLKKEITRIGNTWINYPLGVVREFVRQGVGLGGLEMLFAGDIPNEAGLSSSASIEMVTAVALNEIFSAGIGSIDLVKIGQRAENDFVGMKCGIMDQFAVTISKKDHAVYLDCGTLDYRLVPFNLGDYTLVIINTNKKRGLAGSAYNQRRMECEKAVEYISRKRPVNSLSDLDWEEYSRLRETIPDPVARKRADHVISENARVKAASVAMERGDLEKLGKLMVQSHRSLRDDYEVSCTELDAVVDLSIAFDGVLGSRMTGAGFGGCAISLVPSARLDEFTGVTGKEYKEKTGLDADFYMAVPGPGARELKLS